MHLIDINFFVKFRCTVLSVPYIIKYMYILIYTNTFIIQFWSHSLHCIMTKLNINSVPFNLKIFLLLEEPVKQEAVVKQEIKQEKPDDKANSIKPPPEKRAKLARWPSPRLGPWVGLNLRWSALGPWPCLTCYWKWGWTMSCSPRRDAGLYSHGKNLIVCHFCLWKMYCSA